MEYSCVPEWQQATVKDQFDYKLRTKEEVKNEFKYHNAEFNILSVFKGYTAGNPRLEDNMDTRERVAKIWVDLREMKLAPLQRQRFVFLLGPRYLGSHKVKLVCRQYITFHENYVRVMEILREIYWESKRAPDVNTTMLKNPYRREYLLKKVYGKTKEQRTEAKKAEKLWLDENTMNIDAAEMGLVNTKIEETDNRRKKMREIAAKRLKLGFKDASDEVEDKILESMEEREKIYKKQIEEDKERKPVQLVTEVKGLSKSDLERQILTDAEKFKPI